MSDAIQRNDGTIIFGNTSGLIQYSDDEWNIFEPFVVKYIDHLEPSLENPNKIWSGGRGNIGYFLQLKNGSYSYTSLFDKLPDSLNTVDDIYSIRETTELVYFFSNDYTYEYSKTDSSIRVVPEIKYEINKIGKPINLARIDNRELYFLDNGDVVELLDGVWKSINLELLYNGNTALANPITNLLQQIDINPDITIEEIGLSKISDALHNRLERESIQDIALFKNGDIAIASGKDIFIVNSEGVLIHSLTSALGFADDFISDLLVDQNGDLWAMGEITVSIIYTSVPVYHIPGEPLNFGVSIHVHLFEDKLFIATDKGFYRLDRPLSDFTVSVDKLLTKLSNEEKIFYQITEVDGELWVGSESGLYRIVENQLVLIFENIHTRYIHRLNNEVILIQTQDGVLWCKKIEGKWILKEHIPNIDEEIYQIAIESEDTFWAGGYRGDVYKGYYSEKSGSFQIQKFDFETGLPDAGIAEPAVNGDLITINTNDGLYTFDDSTSSFSPIVSINEQLGSWAEFLTQDNSGNLWTMYADPEGYVGIIKISPDKENEWIANYTPFEISPDIFFDYLDFEDSYLITGGIDAIVQMDFATNYEHKKPEVKFWGARLIRNQEIISYNSEYPLTTSFDKKNVELQFVSTSFRSPSKNQYRFKVGETDWTTWRNDSKIFINPILPGKQTITVQTRDFMQVESPPKEFTITILAPWYLSYVAYLIYVLVFIGILVFIVRSVSSYRIRRQMNAIKLREIEKIIELDELKTKLLINISHELRTPLTLVTGPVKQLLDSGKVDDDFLLRKLQVAYRNGRRLHDLVEQVLDLSRLDSEIMQLNPTKIPIASFVKRISESFESAADRKSIKIKVVVPDNEFLIQADADKLEKILVNLLSNAVKFTPEKGSIQVILVESDDSIRIEVRDSGRGIKAEDLNNIFDRFHSTSDQLEGGGQGIGVGLSITKEFVELHEGAITVESEEGKGATFLITLPKKEYDEVAEFEFIEEGASTSTGKVDLKPQINKEHRGEFSALVVEDNPDMREYISELLMGLNLSVEQAANGKQGQQQVSLKKPDIIISDIMMPEMNGFELANWLRSVPEFKQVPIILLSARSEVEDKVHGFQLGVSDYLTKPFNALELQARVDNLLMYKKEREEMAFLPSPERDNPIQSADAELVQELQGWVETNIENSNISVEDLAEQVAMSARNLQRTLKSISGFSPNEFIREVRLYTARDLLETRQKRTVAEVAYAVGFSTPAYFSKLYKRRFGASPAQYF